MKLNKEQLKPLIRMVLAEMARRRTSGASGEYDDYEIEVDNLAIPGVCELGDYALITATIEYNADPGCEGRLYGPPENCYPGEVASVEIINQYPTSLKVTNAANQTMEYDDFKSWIPEQIKPLNIAVKQNVSQHESDIESMILDTIDFEGEPDEPDRDDDGDFDRY